MFIKNTAVTGLTFGLVNNSTGSPLTGAATCAWIAKDGAAAASVNGISPSELSNGMYKMNLAASDMNAAIIGLGFTAASAVPVYFTLITIPASAIAASNIGGSAFDATVFKTSAISVGVLAASAIAASNQGGSSIDATLFKTGAIPVGVIGASAIGASNISGSAFNSTVFAGSVIDNALFAANSGSVIWNAAVRSLTDKAAFSIATNGIAVGSIAASAIAASAFSGSAITNEILSATAGSQVWNAAVRAITGTVTVATNNDKTGYSLAASAIGASQFAASSIDGVAVSQSAGSRIWDAGVRTITGGTIATVSDKTGYSLAASAVGACQFAASAIDNVAVGLSGASQIWNAAVRSLTDKTGFTAAVSDKTGFSLAANGVPIGALAASAIAASNIGGSAITQEEFAATAASQVWRSAVRSVTDKTGFALGANGIPVGAFAASSLGASAFAGSAINNTVLAGSAVNNAVFTATVSTTLAASAIGACQFAASAIDNVAIGLSGASQVWNAAVRSLTDKTGFTAAVSDKTGFSLAQGGIPVGAFAASAIAASAFSGSAITNQVYSLTAASQVWDAAVRALTAFGFSVTVGTNSDKTGYSLSASAIGACQFAASAVDGVAVSQSAGSRVWDAGVRTLTNLGASTITASTFGASAIDKVAFAATAGSQIWDAGVRTITGTVTVATNSDKTGYSLAASAIGACQFAASAIDEVALGLTGASQIWRAAVRTVTDKTGFSLAANGVPIGALAASAIAASNIGGSAITQEEFSATAASQVWRSAVRNLTAMGFTVTLAQSGIPVGAFAASAISASVFAGSAIDNRAFADNAGSTIWNAAVRATTGGVITTNNDKTGYSLAASAIGACQFAASAIDNVAVALTAASQIWNAAVRGITVNADKTGYTVSTVQDKTGYGLTASAIGACQFAASGIDGIALGLSGASQVWNAAVRSLTDKTGFTAAVSDKSGFSLAQGGVPVGALAASAIGASNIGGSALSAPVFAGSAIDNKVFADNAGSAIWNSAVRSLTDEIGFALAASSIDANTFANGAITAGVFATGAIAVGKIGASAIGASNLAGSAITQEELSATAASQIWRSAVRSVTDKTNFQIAQGGIAIGSIAASVISTSNIGGSAFDNTLFKSNAIGIGTLAASTLAASNIGGSALDSTIIKSNALDGIAVSDPGAVAITFPQMLVQTWRRFFKKSTLTSTQLKTFKDDGSTTETTQTVSDDGTTQTQGTAT